MQYVITGVVTWMWQPFNLGGGSRHHVMGHVRVGACFVARLGLCNLSLQQRLVIDIAPAGAPCGTWACGCANENTCDTA
jgi:hypothetical protein